MNAEMEISTLIGRNLNFQASRQAAFEGDIVKSKKISTKTNQTGWGYIKNECIPTSIAKLQQV